MEKATESLNNIQKFLIHTEVGNVALVGMQLADATIQAFSSKNYDRPVTHLFGVQDVKGI